MDNVVPLFNEYRLIERSENEINGAWKGAHLLLFFLAFVFGSFCTFCFHMLMYLFDEKCVLFPKLLSLTSLRHNVIYEFIPSNKDLTDMPVDFLSTQWVEKSTCSLPTYVPLVSGIFGLVWTTMFLMCSTGSRTLTGLQRPWRVLPPVFLFSLAMSALCIYSSAVTHYGLQELCIKLGEITGSSTCTYTVNVATLTYERRIRGVYQATRLTILSAWLHTACWLLSALLALVRVLMAVDFQLVRINVELHGDIDKILEKHEVQIRTVLPEGWINDEYSSESDTKLPTEVKSQTEEKDELTKLQEHSSETLYISVHPFQSSELSLVPEESNRIARLTAYRMFPKDKQFIVKWVYDLVHTIQLPETNDSDISLPRTSIGTTPSSEDEYNDALMINRQYGQENISSKGRDIDGLSKLRKRLANSKSRVMPDDGSYVFKDSTVKGVREMFDFKEAYGPISSSSRDTEDSVMNLTADLKQILKDHSTSPDDEQNMTSDEKDDDGKDKYRRKSNLKTIGVQTEKGKKSKRGLHVQISEKSFYKYDTDSDEDSSESGKKDEVDKETQTRPKEKQD